MHFAAKAKHLTQNKGIIFWPVEILGLFWGFSGLAWDRSALLRQRLQDHEETQVKGLVVTQFDVSSLYLPPSFPRKRGSMPETSLLYARVQNATPVCGLDSRFGGNDGKGTN